ncbi:serine hydrolase [Frateuria sp. GZRR33]|uniref:serine hydrolase n=1 Tax=Frateuria sp. GZRR33 TaxID=3351535 RepID=UPI003EDBB780
MTPGSLRTVETPAEEQQRLKRGYRAFLGDPRNCSTPEAAAMFLDKLWRRQLLSAAATADLLDFMDAQRKPRHLRAAACRQAL